VTCQRHRRIGLERYAGVYVTAIPSSNHQQVAQIAPSVLLANLSAQSEGVLIVPKKGLQLPSQLPFKRWMHIGMQLSVTYTSSAWCLGDWLVYGETFYNGRYRDAIEQTALDYQTLRNYAWVVRRFALHRRRDTLSFGHHAEVAALCEPEQDFWLRKAESLRWSRNRLRREVRASQNERSAGSGPDNFPLSSGEGEAECVSRETEHSRLKIQLNISAEQMGRCQAAAEKAGLTIEEWAVVALDLAASVPAHAG
jgi:hypothetical protein